MKSDNFLNKLNARAKTTPIQSQFEDISEDAEEIESSLNDTLEAQLLKELEGIANGSIPETKLITRSEEVTPVRVNLTSEETDESEDGVSDFEQFYDDDDEDDSTSINEDHFPMKKILVSDEVKEQHKKNLEVFANGLPWEPDLEFLAKFAEVNRLTDDQALDIWRRDTQKNADALSRAEYDKLCSGFKTKYQFTDVTEKSGKFIPMSDDLKKEFHIIDSLSPMVLENFLDYIYETLKDREVRHQNLLNLSKNNAKALARESAKANERDRKRKAIQDKNAADHRIASGQDAGDKRLLMERKQELHEGREAGMSTEDMLGDMSDEAKMPETEIYYWQIGVDKLREVYDKNLEIVYSGGGRFGGIEFGWKTRFPFLRGIDNSELYHYQTMTHIDRGLVDTLYSLPGNARTFWLQLFNGSPDQSRISKFASYVLDVKKHKTHSITGKHLAWKMIPPLEAFDQKILDIDPLDLLSLLPEAEADTFLLHLGKTAFGLNKIEIVEGIQYRSNEVVETKVSLPYRAIVTMHGDRNVGKSEAIKLVSRAFTYGGYSVRSLGTTFNQFGWKPVLTCDLVTIDDTVPKKLREMQENEKIKIAASGGVQEAEPKGRDGMEGISRASFIMAANRLAFPREIDSGVTDRFHFLQIKSQQQMNALSVKRGRNMYPAALWNNLSEDLGVDVDVFGLYLIREGIRRYIEAAGLIEQEDGTFTLDPTVRRGKPGVEVRLEKNRSNYVFQAPCDEKEYITAMARRCYVITDYLEPSYTKTMHDEYDNSFHAFTLLHTANVITRLQNEIKECEVAKDTYRQFEKDAARIAEQDAKQTNKRSKLVELMKWIDPKGMISTAVWIQLRRYWQTKGQGGHEIGDNKKFTLEAIWAEFVDLITTFDGRTIEKNRPDWTSSFLSAKNNAEGYKTELDAMLKEFIGDLTEVEVKNLRRIATNFGYPITEMKKDEIYFKDVFYKDLQS